jgi:hypothetical protein
MAPPRHNLSRRAVLGAGVVAPVILAGGGAVGLASTGGGGGGFCSGAGGAGAAEAVASSRPDRGEALSCAQLGRKAQALRLGWTRALERFRRAEAALDECRARHKALPAAQRAFPHSQALDDEFGRVDDVRIAALLRLLRRRAPDLAALADKIELIVADHAWELTGAERCLNRLRDDAKRLADGG